MSGSKTEVQAYESQAIGRAHRQGQKGEVTVVRLIIKNSVEHEMYLAAKEPVKPGKFSLYLFKTLCRSIPKILLRYTRLVVYELI
jgi:superfamily II DNA or RNA helicase